MRYYISNKKYHISKKEKKDEKNYQPTSCGNAIF
jgi:hypothetical protein